MSSTLPPLPSPPVTGATTSLPRSQKSSITYKSNLPKSLRSTHPSGILHATRYSTSTTPTNSPTATLTMNEVTQREEHTFVWIQNYTGTSEKLVLDTLAKYGFVHSPAGGGGGENNGGGSMYFIPYSTKSAWCTKYPNAIPLMECVDVISTTAAGGGEGGGVVQTIINGYPMWNHNVQSVPDVPREVVHATGYYGVQPVSDEDIAIGNKRGRDGSGSGSSSDYGPKSFTRGLLTNAQRSELHSEIYNYFVWLRLQVKAESSSSGGSGKKSVNGMSSDSLKEMLKCMDAALPSAKSGGSSSGSSGADQPTPFLEEALYTKLKHRLDSGMGSTQKSSSASTSSNKKLKIRKVRKEKGTFVSWEERMKQLTAFGVEHGHYDVPMPLEEEGGDGGGAEGSTVNDDDVRFYNWVQKIHYELRAYNNGNTTKLTKERAEQLAAINFEANDAKPRGRPRIQQVIPDVSWKKRLQQVQSYKDDVGHLNIDHQYKHCDNLGGWAVEISNTYQNWKEGKEVVSPEMEEHFNELKALGFNFDIKECYEVTRSWDDHYEMLVQYKEKNGNARVPLKWKADLRLGKWVQLQRKAKRTNKLSEEHREKLERIGFEWEVPVGQQQSDVAIAQVRV